ncbi:MarR family winged helix-turn-helix transcriptional regulator [Georgenia sp. Z1491]|uniref:MarR family winged helix-turn-helix transcriptional regulator n=1 Tax=Georgenia sp. Z1491 TaxID=3416707 RepID=UPI003CEDC119
MDSTRDAAGGDAPPDTGMRLSSSTWEALLRAEVTLMRTFEASGDFQPLSKTEYDVLFILATAPGRSLRMRDLNEQVLMAQPSLSRMADRLAAKGYLRRTPAVNDARGTNLVLTEEGLEMQRAVGRRHVRTIHAEMSVLDEDEQRELRRLLRKVRTEARPADPRSRRSGRW